VTTASRSEQSTPRPVLSNVAVGVVGAIVLLLPVALAAVLLLVLGVEDAPARIEAVKTAAITGLGLSGMVALLLAARRQRGIELERWNRYRAVQDAVAARERADERRDRADAERRRDAAGRRDTELYARAVDQLGSDRAAVRLGGLYALERLGEDSVGQRQLVVDVLCAYLRMPPASTADHPGRQEREVRLTAQRILHRHLQGSPGDPAAGTGQAARHWAGADLDLSGAWLEDFTLTGCDVGTARFDGARFEGPAALDRARFHGPVTFRDAHFGSDATFAGTQFAAVGFDRAALDGRAWFGETEFGGDAAFDRTRFGAAAEFERALFRGEAEFGAAEFAGPAGFRRVRFAASARFDRAHFGDAAMFDHARFDGDARFGQARFAATSDFGGARADDWAPERPSSWPQGWTTRRAEELGHLAVVETAPEQTAPPVPVTPAGES
jgi:hypothetical protein